MSVVKSERIVESRELPSVMTQSQIGRDAAYLNACVCVSRVSRVLRERCVRERVLSPAEQALLLVDVETVERSIRVLGEGGQRLPEVGLQASGGAL